RWTRPTRARASALAMAGSALVVAPSVVAWRESQARTVLGVEQTKTKAALNDAVKARGELQAKLDEGRRLSDIQQVRDVLVQSTKLGPALPDRIDRFDRCLRAATELFDRLPQHEATLAKWKAMPSG